MRIVEIPNDFLNLLKEEQLPEIYEKMSYPHSKEYVVWINDTKKDETRRRRMEKAIEMLRKVKKNN